MVAKTLLVADSIFDRFLAAGSLLEAGDRAGYDLLAEGLLSADQSVARAAMDTLLSIPDFCVLGQVVADASSRPILNEAMMYGIAYFSRHDALPVVRQALGSTVSTVRIAALRAVARLHDGESRDRVRDALATRAMLDNERANVYYVLAVLGDGEEHLGEILELVQNPETAVREIAIVALGSINNERSRETLGRLVEDQNARVRVAALGSHINVGGEQSVEALEYLITTGRKDHAMIAAAALKRIPEPVALGVIKRITECCELEAEVALRLMETWGRMSIGKSVDIAIPAWGLRHSDLFVRMQTLWALGSRADLNSRKLMLPYLKDNDPAMRGMAAWAIARSGVAAKTSAEAPGQDQHPACPVHYQPLDKVQDVKSAMPAEIEGVWLLG